MIRCRAKLLIVLSLLVFAGCSKYGSYRITILHTNDMHGHFVPEPASWLDDKPLVGGFVALDYYVKQERAKAPASLLLDAGDLMTGNLICNLDYEGAEGGALVVMMNKIGYDGMVIGNHEFDKPSANVRKLIGLADFPIFCANLVDNDGNNFTKEKYHIYTVGGARVGVIGITYHHMEGMAKAEFLDGFDSLEPAPVVNDIVEEIDPKTDLIIVLSHLGYENDVELAKQIKGVDLIIGGHSHTRLEKPEVVNGVIIVQAGSYTRNLGELELTISGDSVEQFSGHLITTFADSIVPDPALERFADSCQAIIDEEFGKVIGTLKSDWIPEYRAESNIGDFLTDQIREKTGADVAFVNSGGIRKRMSAGPITLRDIHEMLPFQNYIQTFECKGSDLIKIVNENATAQSRETHGILQISGLSYSWRAQNGGVKVSRVMVGKKQLDPNKTYSVSTLDYVISNGDKYLMMQPQNVNGSILFSDLIIESVKEKGDIISRVEGRINLQ